MHSYLKSIGFSDIKNKKQIDLVIKNAVTNPTTRTMTTVSSSSSLIQINKEYGEGIGLSVIGEYDNKGFLNVEHYFPYAVGEHVTTEEEISIEKHSSNESYAGVCEDLNVGTSLIFYLQNIADNVRTKWLNHYAKTPTSVKLSGLSTSGTVILDIQETIEDKKRFKGNSNNRNKLIAAARAGDVEAMENLTIDDMDTYTLISKRARSEDIFSIVKTYFMPCGIETEMYSIMGSITDIKEVTNIVSKKIIYNLSVECNNILLNVFISKDDITGEPAIGRRFKGIIWLQGHVNFY